MSESKSAPRWRDRQTLWELYVEQGLTESETATRLGCAESTIHRWLEKHEIQRRGQTPQVLRDEGRMRELYVSEGLSSYEIAERFGTSNDSVLNWLDKHNINRRPSNRELTPDELADRSELVRLYSKQGLTAPEIAEEVGVSTRTVTRWLNKHNISVRDQSDYKTHKLLKDKKALKRLYHEEGQTAEEIGEGIGVDGSAVWTWLVNHGIERRRPGARSGEDAPNWKGGYETYYGPSWPQRRQECLERDDQECQRCGMGGGTHREKYNQSLHVHHIRPFRAFNNHEAANALDNLITLCRECHAKLEGVPIDAR